MPLFKTSTIEFLKNDEVVVQDNNNDFKKTVEFIATNFGSGVCRDKLFFSPTFHGHNFFILTQIWACGMSLESSLNVK